jgi:hypothetical protein
VVAEIVRRGGTAIADGGDVTDFAAMQAMVAAAVAQWGRVDILVNNAGILRDKSFAKMTLDDFQRVMNVHVMGAFNACKAVWDVMREQHFGRIVMTTSSSGLYGNFGQANYGAAKLALVGLMQTLAIEGERYEHPRQLPGAHRVHRHDGGVLPEEALRALGPEKVSPGLVALVGDDAPTRMILLAGAGSFESAHITMTRGVYLDPAHGDVALQLAATAWMKCKTAAAKSCPPPAGSNTSSNSPRQACCSGREEFSA